MTESNKLNLLPGDYVFREGEFGKTAFIVESGTVELVKFTGDKDTILAELEKGALFGEMAIIESSPRSASARAKTNCTLAVVSEEALKKHLSSSPNTALDMMRRLASYARSANEKLSKDAFSEVSLEDDDAVSQSASNKTKKVDFDTSKTLREFNEDLDEFSKINPSRPLAISGFVIILMLIAFGIWASIAEIDVTVSSRGKIMSAIPNVSVQSNYSSVIEEILVEEGQDVKKGQPIASFDETLLAADYRNTREELSAVEKDILRTNSELNFLLDKAYEVPSGNLQRAIFEDQIAEISMQKREHQAKVKGLNVKLNRTNLNAANVLSELEKSVRPDIQRVERQLFVKQQLLFFLQKKPYKKDYNETATAYFDSKAAEIETSLADLDGQVRHLKKEVRRSKALNKQKIIPAAEYEKKVYDLEQVQIKRDKFVVTKVASTFEEIESLSAQLIGLKQRERKLMADVASSDIDRNENSLELMKENLAHEKFISTKVREKNSGLQDLLRKRQGLNEKFIKLSRQIKDVEVLAPISGTILKLEDRFEGSVINSGDVIATIVPEDSNFHVEVDIDPADITNVYEGAEVKIMLDALPSQKHGELKGTVVLLSKDAVDEDVFGEKRSVYRADINIIENNLVELPEGFKLLPSMNVSGNIRSGKRTVMTFLMFPVIKTLQTSFREP